jgi:aldose 1-epimerase
MNNVTIMSDVKVYQLTNKNGLTIEFIANGGKLTSVLMPAGDKKVDVALGYPTAKQFVDGDLYIGAICGRFANRIDQGKFELDGKTIQLAVNDKPNHLHGGPGGFNVKVWDVKPVEKTGCVAAYQLSLTSPDGEENYPGNLNVKAIYGITDKNEFVIEFEATTDKPTIINLTSHPYFNLKGAGHDVLGHTLQVNAEEFTPLGTGVPTGELRKVKGTPFDLNKPAVIGDQIKSDYDQIAKMGGYDHNWVINKPKGSMGLAGKVSDPDSGRWIEVYTTQNGLQVYTSMHFDGTVIGKDNKVFTKYCAIALEAQNFPDAPNKPHFPSAKLVPGQVYKETIIYKFGW